jgi:hypothetical protein
MKEASSYVRQQMQFFTYWLLKVALSAFLVFLMGFAARELVRLWSEAPITLAPFAYQTNGAANEAQGKAFSQRVYHQLQDLQKLFSVEKGGATPTKSDRAVKGTASQGPNGSATQVYNSLEPPPFSLEIAKTFAIPEIRTDYLPGIELKVQGVDFASLARLLIQWADPTDEFGGSIVEEEGVFSAFVERRRSGYGPSDDSRFGPDPHASLGDAVFSVGCNILYVVAKVDNPSLQKLSSMEFELSSVLCGTTRSIEARSLVCVPNRKLKRGEWLSTTQPP